MTNADLQKYWLPILIVLVWSLCWKGWALWRAARKEDKAWFIVFLILNTVGVLEMFYLFIFSKRQPRALQDSED